MERCTLGIVVQLTLDLYNQDYAPQSQFIDASQVAPICANIYAAKLRDEYKANKLLNKAITGFTFVELSPDWLIKADAEVKKEGDEYYALLDRPVFAFDFDATSSGIQYIEAKGSNLVRISVNDKWQYKFMPPGPQVYYFVEGNRIGFLTKEFKPKKITAHYIPSMFPIDLNTPVAQIYADDVMSAALQKLLVAKNGTIIDKTNNANPNVLPQTEIDADTLAKK